MNKIKSELNKSLLASELKCLEILQCTPFVINMLDIITTDKYTYVVTELCKGDLGARRHKRLAEHEAWGYIKQIIQGYRYLHRKGIVHRDLKPENFFVDDLGNAKIGDFGFAATLKEARRQLNYNIGSPSYMAPEVLSRNCYSHASDIWAIGISYY
jgi:serine/threonine protein kinase